MKVDFNNLRRQISTQFDALTEKLNEAIKSQEIDEDVVANIQPNMDNLYNRIVSLMCCYDDEKIEEFSDLSDDVNIREFNPLKRYLTIISKP